MYFPFSTRTGKNLSKHSYLMNEVTELLKLRSNGVNRRFKGQIPKT